MDQTQSDFQREDTLLAAVAMPLPIREPPQCDFPKQRGDMRVASLLGHAAITQPVVGHVVRQAGAVALQAVEQRFHQHPPELPDDGEQSDFKVNKRAGREAVDHHPDHQFDDRLGNRSPGVIDEAFGAS